MAFRPLLIIAVFIGAALAGCASKPETATPAADAPAAGVPLVDDGSKANATTMDHMATMPHMHDYWKGKERVQLFDGDLKPNEENATFATLAQLFIGRGVAAGGMQWFLPDGTTIYEGTGAVELTATWNDPLVTGVSFIYRSAESQDIKNGASLVSGTTFSLPVTPVMTDMPHSKVSKWWFAFGPDKSPGALLGTFHLKVEIVRLHDIMTFPAHPDFWQGKRALTMLDADHRGSQQSYALRATQPATQGDFNEDWVNFSALVPMETKAIQLNFTITAASSTPGQVASFGLFYKTADTTSQYRCPPQPIGKLPATLSWLVPVTAENSDSPYAKASQWRILLEPQVTLTGQDPDSGGTTNVDYAYHGTVTALDVEQADAKACRLDQQPGGG